MRTFGTVFCLLLLASPVFATHVGLYTSTDATSCSTVADDVVGVIEVFVVVTGNSGVTGTSFRVVLGGGLINDIGWTQLAGSCTGACDPYVGVDLVASSCVAGNWPVASLAFLKHAGRMGSCDQLRVIGISGDSPVVLDCTETPYFATGGSFSFMDATGDCADCDNPLPTETRTWGNVKALYR